MNSDGGEEIVREEACSGAHGVARHPSSAHAHPGDGNRLKDHLWRFRNTFTAEEAAEINRIIEEDCERIEADES